MDEVEDGMVKEAGYDKMNIQLKKKYFFVMAYLYMMLPVMIFMLTWLKIYVGIPMAAIMAVGWVYIYRHDYKNYSEVIQLPLKHICIIALLLFLWVILSGSGKLFYETADWHARNAIFRDLIDFPWPVVYEQKGTALVYYLLQWIVPAGFGKLFGWQAGNIALLVWNFIGVLLAYMLLVHLCKNSKKAALYTIMLIFIFFGGLNQVGKLTASVFAGAPPCIWGSEDGWLDFVNGYQYSSNDTLLSWVFNQTIVPWIAVALAMSEKRIRNFAFIGLLVLPFAPLPFIGIFIMLMTLGAEWCVDKVKEKQYKCIFYEIFSIPNISAICSVFLCFWPYFSASKNGMRVGWYIEPENFGLKEWAYLTVFFFFEVGVYVLPLWKIYKKDVLFHVAYLAMYLIPIVRVGAGRDFCMRAPVGLLFLLQIYIMRYIVSKKAFSYKQLSTTILLIMILTLGGFNIVAEYGGKLYDIKLQGRFPVICDDVITLKDKEANDDYYGNFLAENYKEKIFFKYMAR